MHNPRFVFLTAPMPGGDDRSEPANGILWILVSQNNRPLGRAARHCDTYAGCRGSVLLLQDGYERVHTAESTTDRTGQWAWRVSLDGSVVAVSSRSYLRARECSYNLDRFLDALPHADIVDGTRSARRGRRVVHDGEPPPRAMVTAADRLRTYGGPPAAQLDPARRPGDLRR